MCDHLFVVTGGPGSGKSSLIEALVRRGFHSKPEAGRAIIRHQVAIGGTALPWADRASFAELMLSWEIRSHDEASHFPGPVLMDRGAPDIAGYLTLCGLPVPAHVETAARLYRYNPRVFLAPFWPDIFTQDSERKQDLYEARATGEIMAETYSRLGYSIIELPLASIDERASFVVRTLQTT